VSTGPRLFPVQRSRALAEVSTPAVRAASERIANCIHPSPAMLAWLPRTRREPLLLKLESLQVGHSVISRGVINLVHTAPPERIAAGLVTVWLGHVGPATLRVGLELGVPTTVYVCRPMAWPESMAMFRQLGGNLVVAGATWQEAERLARRRAARDGACFVHPFADAAVINGCATLALELFAMTPPPRVVVIPASPACGLAVLGAFAMVAHELQPGVRVIGAELSAAPLLSANLEHGGTVRTVEGVPLEHGPASPDQLNLDLVRRYVDDVVLVSDAEVRLALETLWSELEAGSSPAGGTAVAAVLSGRVDVAADERVAVVVGETGFHGLFGASAAPRVGIG
jgi:threonine dehydratase